MIEKPIREDFDVYVECSDADDNIVHSERKDPRSTKTCLVLTLLFLTVSNSIQSQVLPKVFIDHYIGDDGDAAEYFGWISSIGSILQLILLPSLTTSGDVVGRHVLLKLAVITQATSMLVWSFFYQNIYLSSAASIISGLSWLVVPVSQSIIGDISKDDRASSAHNFGIISATFGLGLFVGPFIGGVLVGIHETVACFASAGTGFVSVIVCVTFNWKEKYAQTPYGDNRAAEEMKKISRYSSAATLFCKAVNPFTFFLNGSQYMGLRKLAAIYCITAVSLNAYFSWYILLDYKLKWSSTEIGSFISFFGLMIAVVQSLLIRLLIPRIFTRINAALVGLIFMALSLFLYAFASSTWEMYFIAPFAALGTLAEPCIQSLMSSMIPPNSQGALQGAIFSLRILAQGVTAPLYGLLFRFGTSSFLLSRVHFLAPGLTFLFAAVCATVAAIITTTYSDGQSKPSKHDLNDMFTNRQPLLSTSERTGLKNSSKVEDSWNDEDCSNVFFRCTWESSQINEELALRIYEREEI